ncbi:hypothetical protein XPN_1400 [Xanthomonas arboricola pv. pruni MAFF 301427]|nr:hypothetical protein XPN_1400 [Xanthomonas arboricola pv. pruni MAFF 301427]
MPKLSALFAPIASRRGHWWAWACLWIAGLVVCGHLQAQTYSFRDYAQADGLQGMTVNSLLEDRQGVVWVGTELALHRFERESFIPVGQESGLDARYIRALALDAAGRLWVASANGVFVRDGSAFVQLLRDGKPIRADSGNVLAAYADGMVVVSENALLRLSPDHTGGWSVHPLPLQLADGTSLPAGKALLADGTALWSSCGPHVCRIDENGRTELLGEATECRSGSGGRSFATTRTPCGCAAVAWCCRARRASVYSATMRRRQAPASTRSRPPPLCPKMHRAAC